MAGHSKWANIRHRKAAQDAKRGKIFTKMIREIVVAAREGGAIVEDNPRLRTIIDKALAVNMKRDTIDKAIARGAGNDASQQYDELTYEGYGLGGVAIMVACMTDNRNRTVSEVRHAFTKMGGQLGTDGSVAYLFSKKGQILLAPGVDEEHIMELTLEAGGEDVVVQEDGVIEIITTPKDYPAVKTAIEADGVELLQAELAMIPANYVALDIEAAARILQLIDALEDLDDVQQVYHNAQISDDLLDQL